MLDYSSLMIQRGRCRWEVRTSVLIAIWMMHMKIVVQPSPLKECLDMKRSSTAIDWSHIKSIVVTLVWSHHHLSILPCRLCLLECTRCKIHILEIRFIHWKSTCTAETVIKLLIVPDKVEPVALRGTRTILFLIEETSGCCCIHSSSLDWGLVDLGSESDLLGSTAQGLGVDRPRSRMHNRLWRHWWLLHHLLFGSVLRNYRRMI